MRVGNASNSRFSKRGELVISKNTCLTSKTEQITWVLTAVEQ